MFTQHILHRLGELGDGNVRVVPNNDIGGVRIFQKSEREGVAADIHALLVLGLETLQQGQLLGLSLRPLPLVGVKTKAVHNLAQTLLGPVRVGGHAEPVHALTRRRRATEDDDGAACVVGQKFHRAVVIHGARRRGPDRLVLRRLCLGASELMLAIFAQLLRRMHGSDGLHQQLFEKVISRCRLEGHEGSRGCLGEAELGDAPNLFTGALRAHEDVGIQGDIGEHLWLAV